MRTQTMEGLIGANTNFGIMKVPVRVYKEAERRGDTAVMERAMGYANDFAEKTEECKNMAYEGMKKDAEDAREQTERIQEEVIEKHKEERKKLQEQVMKKHKEEHRGLQEQTEGNDSTIEVSEEKVMITPDTEPEETDKSEEKAVAYTKTGEADMKEMVGHVSILI